MILASSAYANQELIEKANLAKQRTHLAFSQAGGGPELHRALITAYWVNQGDFVLDLGAHKGIFSRFYSNLVGHDGLVFAYEASPPIYEHLLNQLSTLGITNIIPKNRAISDTTNSVLYMKIYPNDTDPQSCTVEQAHWNEERMPGNTSIVTVLTEKVDDILENQKLPPVRFIKIDTEGHEHAVIRGARNVLLMQRPLVIFEYGYQKGHWEPDTIRQIEEIGYICYDCNTDRRVHPDYGNEAVPYLLTDILAIPIEFECEVTTILPYLY
ncbi:MAG: FkbM family methyltransferase [Simkaniaceae bacterium]|nr:FkbM family methyltransferase [Simkaniaceae bacterium]